jgi:hypothetical protein
MTPCPTGEEKNMQEYKVELKIIYAKLFLEASYLNFVPNQEQKMELRQCK